METKISFIPLATKADLTKKEDERLHVLLLLIQNPNRRESSKASAFIFLSWRRWTTVEILNSIDYLSVETT